MALVLLTEAEKIDLRINSFDPQTGFLGVGFVFNKSTTNDANTQFINFYDTNDTAITQVLCVQNKTRDEINLRDEFNAYTLNKDV